LECASCLLGFMTAVRNFGDCLLDCSTCECEGDSHMRALSQVCHLSRKARTTLVMPCHLSISMDCAARARQRPNVYAICMLLHTRSRRRRRRSTVVVTRSGPRARATGSGVQPPRKVFRGPPGKQCIMLLHVHLGIFGDCIRLWNSAGLPYFTVKLPVICCYKF
jgi:hypothetical protein